MFFKLLTYTYDPLTPKALMMLRLNAKLPLSRNNHFVTVGIYYANNLEEEHFYQVTIVLGVRASSP